MKAAAVSRLTPVAALVVAGCTTVAPSSTTLEGTTWRVAAIDGQATPATNAYRLDFREGRIGGKFGCNSFSGPYGLTGSTVTAGNIAATRMFCEGPAGTFETEGLAVLQRPMQVSWQSDARVTLSNSAGSIALERLP